MSEAWSQEFLHESNIGGLDSSAAARAEAFVENRNRSSSRSSQGRVEKRIEATLADAEPSSHARSRKSSHTLGLFKENNASQSLRRGTERSRAAPDNVIEAKLDGTKLLDERSSEDSQRGRPVPLQDEQISPAGNAERLVSVHSVHTHKDHKHNDASLQSLDSSVSNGSPSSPYGGDTGDTLDTSKRRIAERYQQTQIPPRLLEEIRDYHNLAAPFHDKFRLTQPKAAAPKVDLVDEKPSSNQSGALVSGKNDRGMPNSSQVIGDLENEDEEAEHISSALYYPHEAPSPDTLEDVSIDDARKAKNSEVDMDTELPEPAISIADEDEVPSDDVDIALQMHNKNRYLHGDLQQARQPSQLETKPVFDSGLSSASESEYESQEEAGRPAVQDDSSLTDVAEATPRASPNSRKSYLLSRTRKTHRTPTAPLRAVELKPYNHQVGGHTTVFRFSKRAVCKQLSNRENEFYEVVEREHPELLKFLPR